MTEVVVAKTFFDSAGRLAANDRARVFDFMAKLHANPANPGTSLERVTDAKDKGIWSARITQGLRAILHKDSGRAVLLYAGQHEDAYNWAARRRLSPHPQTGVLQIIETSEEVEQRIINETAAVEDPPLFPVARYEADYLSSLGVPAEWLPTIRLLRTEDQLLDVSEKLPEEVAERLFDLASGKVVTPPPPAPAPLSITHSPDSLRRFFVLKSAEDLEEVLNQPLEAWIRFLHPSQRDLVEKSFTGPVKVTGSAGTGKTVVALHRARALARQGKHVLLTSFVTTLCRNLERNLRVLCRPDEFARIKVDTVHRQAFQLARTANSRLRARNDNEVHRLLERNRERAGVDAERSFLRSEWKEVIDRQGVMTWDAYRDADRRGRGRPLSARERERLWPVFAGVWADLELENRTTWDGLCRAATEQLDRGLVPSPYDAVVVDEVQDLAPAGIQFLAALGGKGRDALFLVGDAGQRIYPGGFSLRALGIDVRGRSRNLRINYRTTEQIQRVADRILGESADDLDGGAETRRGTLSLLHGPEPTLTGLRSDAEERAFAVETIQGLMSEGLSANEIALFARTKKIGEDFGEALERAKIPVQPLSLSEEADEEDKAATPGVTVGTMHRAKGLEFKAVLVVGCDDKRLPNAFVLEKIMDPDEREAAIAQERRLLYVSLTRARDEAFITWSGKPSRFVNELLVAGDSR